MCCNTEQYQLRHFSITNTSTASVRQAAVNKQSIDEVCRHGGQLNNDGKHIMDLLWEKVQWILPLYMTPISFQSTPSVVCSVTVAMFMNLCLKKLSMFSQHIGNKTNEYLNSTEQIPRNWNVDQLSVLITSWDITYWCSINLLWKELMERMSEHTGLISSYQLLITVACTNIGGKMKASHPRAADRCPLVPRHS